MKSAQIFVFLDTMVYLHCTSIDDIPFPDILDADHVTIVIPRITVQELDKHKNTHPSQNIRDRARRALKLIHSHATGECPPIRQNVNLQYFHGTKTFDYAGHGLDPTWNDDLLLGSIILFKESNSGVKVVLVSYDTGPQLTAHHHSIECIELPSKYQLPTAEDPLLKENRQLKNDLLRLQNISPRLLIGFQDCDDEQAHHDFILTCPNSIPAFDKDILLRKLREAFPPIHPPATPQKAKSSASAYPSLLAGINFDPIPDYEYDRYNSGLESFFTDHIKYLEQLAAYRTRSARTIVVELDIRNSGSAPADDIDLHMHFPDGFDLYTDADLPDEPIEPKPPDKPRSHSQLRMSVLGRSISLPSLASITKPSVASSFSLKRTNSYDLKDHFDRLKHGYLIRLKRLHVVFPSYEAASSFRIGYSISAANVPQATNAALDIVIKKS